MPGSLQVILRRTRDAPSIILTDVRLLFLAGETVFYDANILHCAGYNPRMKRATLHACMGETSGGSTRARGIFQHGLTWMKEGRFKDTLQEGRPRDMLERLIRMREGFGESETVYSQVG